MRRNREACLGMIDRARSEGKVLIFLAWARPIFFSPEDAADSLGLSDGSTEIKPMTAYRDVPEFWAIVDPLAMWAHRMMVQKDHSIEDNREQFLIEGAYKEVPPVSGRAYEYQQSPETYLSNLNWIAGQHAKYKEITDERAKRYEWPEDVTP